MLSQAAKKALYFLKISLPESVIEALYFTKKSLSEYESDRKAFCFLKNRESKFYLSLYRNDLIEYNENHKTLNSLPLAIL